MEQTTQVLGVGIHSLPKVSLLPVMEQTTLDSMQSHWCKPLSQFIFKGRVALALLLRAGLVEGIGLSSQTCGQVHDFGTLIPVADGCYHFLLFYPVLECFSTLCCIFPSELLHGWQLVS